MEQRERKEFFIDKCGREVRRGITSPMGTTRTVRGIRFGVVLDIHTRAHAYRPDETEWSIKVMELMMTGAVMKSSCVEELAT